MLAVLVFGGINRTMAKTSDEYGTGSGVGAGKGQFDQMAESKELQGQDNSKETFGGQGQQAGGSRQNENSSEQRNMAAEQFTELVELDGNIIALDLTEAVLFETEDGQIVLEGRGLSFAVSEGFVAQMGDDVQLQGFYEGTEFEIVKIENLTSGLTTTLREPAGRPLWAGGGRTW